MKLKYIIFIFFTYYICQYAQAQTSDSLVVDELRNSGVKFSQNNSIALLMSGQEKFDDMFKAIRQARSSIHLEYFNFRNDSIAGLLFNLLAEAAAFTSADMTRYIHFGAWLCEREVARTKTDTRVVSKQFFRKC